MRIGHRLGVPRAGISSISVWSNATISAMMRAAPAALSHSEYRASFRAASARRECEGVRTSCFSARPDTVSNCAGYDGRGAGLVVTGILFGAFRAEDRDRDRASLRE